MGYRTLVQPFGLVGTYLFVDCYKPTIAPYLVPQFEHRLYEPFGHEFLEKNGQPYSVVNLGFEFTTSLFFTNCNVYFRQPKQCMDYLNSLGGVTDPIQSVAQWQLLNGFDIQILRTIPIHSHHCFMPFIGAFYHPVRITDRSILNARYQCSENPYQRVQEGAFKGIAFGTHYQWRFVDCAVKGTLDNVSGTLLNFGFSIRLQPIIHVNKTLSVHAHTQFQPRLNSQHVAIKNRFNQPFSRHLAPTYDFTNTNQYISKKVHHVLRPHLPNTINSVSVETIFLNLIVDKLAFHHKYSLNMFRGNQHNNTTPQIDPITNPIFSTVHQKEYMVGQIWLRLKPPSRRMYARLALYTQDNQKAIEYTWPKEFVSLIQRIYNLPYEIRREIIAYALANEPILTQHRKGLSPITWYDSLEDADTEKHRITDHAFMLNCTDLLVEQLSRVDTKKVISLPSWEQYLQIHLKKANRNASR